MLNAFNVSMQVARYLIYMHVCSVRICGIYIPCVRDTGWWRPIGCLKLQVIFRKSAINYRALLRKMTYKDKAFYGSSPPCSCMFVFCLGAFVFFSSMCCSVQSESTSCARDSFFSFFVYSVSVCICGCIGAPSLGRCIRLFWVSISAFLVCTGLFWVCTGLFWVCTGLFWVCRALL